MRWHCETAVLITINRILTINLQNNRLITWSGYHSMWSYYCWNLSISFSTFYLGLIFWNTKLKKNAKIKKCQQLVTYKNNFFLSGFAIKCFQCASTEDQRKPTGVWSLDQYTQNRFFIFPIEIIKLSVATYCLCMRFPGKPNHGVFFTTNPIWNRK